MAQINLSPPTSVWPVTGFCAMLPTKNYEVNLNLKYHSLKNIHQKKKSKNLQSDSSVLMNKMINIQIKLK